MKAHLGFGALLLLGSACSVINSFDDVSAVVADSTGGKSGNGGSNMGGGGSDSGGSASGGMGNAGSGAGGTTTVADPGLILVRGTDADDLSSVLSVLSPQTGEELFRETASISAMAHDPKTDTWYLVKFDSANTKYTLEARSFDRIKNKWTPLGTSIEIPRVLNSQAVVVLSDRVAVLTEDTTTPDQAMMHVFNTTDPEDISEVGTGTLVGPKASIVGALAQKTTLGGTVMVVHSADCSGDATKDCVSLQNVIVAASTATALSPKEVGPGKDPAIGRVALGLDTVDNLALLATPDTSTGSVLGGNIYKFGTDASHDSIGSPISFPLPDNDGATLSGIAFDPCNQIAFIDGPKLNSVRALPLRATTPSASIKDHPSQPGTGLEFEQETHSLLVYYFTNVDHAIVAYKVGGDDQTPSFVTRNADWDPPTDLRPSGVVAATPKKPCQK